MVYTTMYGFVLDLRLFDEGGAGAGAGAAGAGAAGSGGAAAPQAAPETRNGRKQNPLANVQYGRTAQAAQGNAGQDDAAKNGEPSREEWEALKKGKFAKFYGDDVSSTIRDRLKNSHANDDKLAKLQPMLDAMSKKYGKDAGDIDGLMAAYNDDDSLYEDEALERGISVQTLKSLKKLERATAEQQEQAAAQQQEQQFAEHLATLEQQAEELKAEIPGFDLREALQDERFRQLTSPDNGLSVQDAYFAMHHSELMQGMAAAAIQKTKQSLSANIQAGRNRPRENGTRNAAPSLDVKTDPRTLNRQDREQIRRRVRAGEKIYF